MDLSTSNDDSEEPQHAGALKKLEAERDTFLADAASPASALFPHLEVQVKLRVKIAADYRDLQLKNLYDHYRIEVKQATDEFIRGKRRLQSAMLEVAAEKRRRLDLLRSAGFLTAGLLPSSAHSPRSPSPFPAAASNVAPASFDPDAPFATTAAGAFAGANAQHPPAGPHHAGVRRKRRARSTSSSSSLFAFGVHDRLRVRHAAAAAATPRGAEPFIVSLEQQGLVRVALTPDEVNADLEHILRGVDAPRAANGPPPSRSAAAAAHVASHSQQHHANAHTPHQSTLPTSAATAPPPVAPVGPASFYPSSDRAPSGADSAAKPADKIHSSRGILHYYDATFEKGDRVSIFTNARMKPVLRHTGVVQSVNSKEVYIRDDDGNPHRVFVQHLCNNRLSMKKA